MKSSNHYEAAFESFLQSQAIPYMSTRETRRSFAGQEEYGSLKNIDFLVMNRSSVDAVQPVRQSRALEASSWLIDIKGRRFPSGTAHPQYWRNWVSEDDLLSLSRWETIFGRGFQGLLVFAYNVLGDRSHTRQLALDMQLQARLTPHCGLALGAAWFSRNTHYDYHPTRHIDSYELRAGLLWSL